MPRAILDTNILINEFRRRRELLNRVAQPNDCERWARDLIEFRRTDAIVQPVYVEFLCGARDAYELALYDAFLKPFLRANGGVVLAVDWELAERYARRPGRRGRARDLADCLIRSIADRLRREVVTDDRDARRGVGG